MKDFVEYLERMIEGCDSLGGMEREKATYQSVLKEYRKQCNIANVSESFSKDDLLDLGGWFDGSPEFVKEVVSDWLNAR